MHKLLIARFIHLGLFKVYIITGIVYVRSYVANDYDSLFSYI